MFRMTRRDLLEVGMRSKEFGDTSLKCQLNDQIKVSRRQLLRSLGFRGEAG